MKTTIELSTVSDVLEFLQGTGLIPDDYRIRLARQGGILIPWRPGEESVLELFRHDSRSSQKIRALFEVKE